MMTIRVEFIYDYERKKLIENLKSNYVIVDEGKIKKSQKIGSVKKLQYLEIEEKNKNIL